MAGIYIHIPFCKQKCSYCNFHFSTVLKGMPEMQKALLREIQQREEEIQKKPVRTIYFGGGTPSLWSVRDLNKIIEALTRHTSIDSIEEITIEANPDDLNREYVTELKNNSPVNRLSIGIQSFRDLDLKLMNRAHSSAEAKAALDRVFEAGFREITADLIFGLPRFTTEIWLEQLAEALRYPIHHLSCYNLTIEDKTALKYQIQKGLITLPKDELMIEQFRQGAAFLAANGFIQYEISNYAQPGHFAIHNTSYWQNEPYIGIGPSAHSYLGTQRRWNVANNAQYMKALAVGERYWETEELSEADRYNECLLTGLRTTWGVTDDKIAAFSSALQTVFYTTLEKEVKRGNILSEGGKHVLTKQGRAIADSVISDFFFV